MCIVCVMINTNKTTTILITSIMLSAILLAGGITSAEAGVIFPQTPGTCDVNNAGIAIGVKAKATSDPATIVPVTIIATNSLLGFEPCEAVLSEVAVTVNNVQICTIDLRDETINLARYNDNTNDGGLTVQSGIDIIVDAGTQCNFSTDPTGVTPAVLEKW